MQTRRTRTWLLMLVAILLVSPLASVRQAVAWACEGRICNTTAWSCCCDAASGRDTNCAAQTVKPVRATLCAAGCGCTQIITASGNAELATHTSKPAAWVPALTDLPAVAILPLPAPPTVVGVAYPVAGRAPPASTGNIACPSLRAPPLSLLLFAIA